MEDIDKLIEEYQESLGRVIARRTEIRARLPEKEPWKGDPALWKKIHVLMQNGRGYPVCVVPDAQEQRGECEDIGKKKAGVIPPRPLAWL